MPEESLHTTANWEGSDWNLSVWDIHTVQISYHMVVVLEFFLLQAREFLEGSVVRCKSVTLGSDGAHEESWILHILTCDLEHIPKPLWPQLVAYKFMITTGTSLISCCEDFFENMHVKCF